MKTVKLVFAALLAFAFTHSKAQLSFPNGTELHLVSHNDVMYEETEILFHTGMYTIEDYEWQKAAFDSLDSRWSFQACLNGECILNLPAKGNFINDFGYNDSTGFIKFHVFTNDFEGTSKISYKVINKLNAADNATLTYYITYEQPTALDEINASNRISVYPNPASDKLTIDCKNDCPATFEIYDFTGKLMQTMNTAAGSSTLIDLGAFSNGLYIIRSQNTQPYTFRVNK